MSCQKRLTRKRHHSHRVRSSHKRTHGRTAPRAQSLQPPANQRIAQTSATCAGAGLTPTPENIASVRAATLCLINRERSAQGEAVLRSNADVQQAAQGHAESMAGGGYFEHTGPSGATVLERLRASGYLDGSVMSYEIGENIAWGSLQDASPAAIVAAWMASPGHRANILNPDFRDTGIGISPRLPKSFGLGESGAMYTQDFGVVM